MTKSKKHLRVSGAVLIMVLIVMVVLIMMLMATLTVVTSAGQRIYTKFEENQAYYTSRSALDVYVNNLMADSAYIAYDSSGKRDYSYTKEDGTIGTTPLKQGLALQLDLYRIKSQNEDGVNLLWAENAVEGDGTFAAGSPEELNYTVDAIDPLNYIEYDVTFPTVSDGSNRYGKIVDPDKFDLDGDGDTTDQVARIKIEVLDRKYAMNPQYTDAEIMAATSTSSPSITDIKTAIANGPRKKDYMKIKLTATVQTMDTEGVSVIIFETTEKESPSTDNALTTTGSFSGGGGAQVRTAGGNATMSTATSFPGDGNNASGSFFTLGRMLNVSSSDIVINENEYIVAWNGMIDTALNVDGTQMTDAYGNALTPTLNDLKVKPTGDGTFVFLGGESITKRNDTFGDATYEVPVIAQKIIKKEAQQLTVNGNMYVNTFHYDQGNPGKVTVTGNAYVQNLLLDSSAFGSAPGSTLRTINMNLITGMNLKLCQGYTITDPADLTTTYTAANMGITWEPLGIDSATFNANYVSSTTPAFDINNFTIEKKDGKIYRKYTLPFSVGGQNEIIVPTAQAYFGEYFKEGAFHETTGELKNFSYQTVDDPTDPNNAYSVIYGSSNKMSWLLTAADMLEDYLELPEVPAGDPARTITSMLANSEITNVQAMPASGEITLDSGDEYYLLSGSYYGQQWNVTGSNGRLILLIEEGDTVVFDNCELTTDVVNTANKNIINGVTESPRVDIYGGTNSLFTTGNQNFIAGYFVMPTGKMYLNNGRSNDVDYTNEGVTKEFDNVAVIGSVLCAEFTESNQTAILYLNKDSGGENPGDPHLAVEAAKYTRK